MCDFQNFHFNSSLANSHKYLQLLCASISQAELFASCTRWHLAVDPRFRSPHTWNDKFAFIRKTFAIDRSKENEKVFLNKIPIPKSFLSENFQFICPNRSLKWFWGEIVEGRAIGETMLYVILTWNYINTEREQRKINSLKYTFGFERRFIWISTCRKGTRYFPQKSMNFMFSTRLSKKTPAMKEAKGLS